MTSHRMSRSPEYQAWNAMRNRCTDPKNASFKRYGGRGIVVCPRWSASFVAFLEDVGPRPAAGYSLERVNNDGNYEPGNCVWAAPKAQARNRHGNRLLSFEGVTLTVSGWAERSGLASATIRARLDRGWSVQEALTRPAQARTLRRAA